MRSLISAILCSGFVFSTTVIAAPFQLDRAHSSINFVAKHLMISNVAGHFDKFDGTFDFDESTMKLENIKVTVDTNSVDTSVPDRDKHLRTSDFFEVDKYPQMTFVSTKINYKKGKPDEVHGNLTLRGVTKPVILEVEYHGAINDVKGNRVIAFEAEGKVNRKDFGMTWNQNLDKGGLALGDVIKIKILGEAKLAAAPPVAK